jgi:hypothetical protein
MTVVTFLSAIQHDAVPRESEVPCCALRANAALAFSAARHSSDKNSSFL